MAGETNKVVIVTGGSSGIGRCTASALKENGCIVQHLKGVVGEGVQVVNGNLLHLFPLLLLSVFSGKK